MMRNLVIVGGGTAGWLSAAYLARMLATGTPAGIRITLVETADNPLLGAEEGSFPSLQRTLGLIGTDEASFMRESRATFTQGTRFDGWRNAPGHSGRDRYFHPFSSAPTREELDLVPYWLLGSAGSDVELDEATTIQKAVADAARAPKCSFDREFTGPLDYGYHFDAAALARFLAAHASRLGVRHVEATIETVNLDERGYIASLTTRERGEIAGDLFVDCTGAGALLIGDILRSPFRSVRQWLFCDRAVTMHIPHDRPDQAIASCTIATAQESGWVWDIGLESRRGTGYVYSSDHTDDSRAEAVLRRHNASVAADLPICTSRFEPGYRETPWIRNCVAIGPSGAVFEPLEANGITLVEIAARLLSTFFPWDGRFETAARQFNRAMKAHYEQALDFLKMHYCLSERRDTAFWRDNCAPDGLTASLEELFDRWRVRPPAAIDFDPNATPFHPDSWKYVLYGMGFRTDLSAQAPALRHFTDARQAFARIRQQSTQAVAILPSHRDLIDGLYRDECRRQACGH